MGNKWAPDIRFESFNEPWKTYKLSSVSDVRDGTHDSPKYYAEGYPLVTSKNLKEKGIDLTDVSLISKEDYESINKRSQVDKGDIIFGMIGTIGNPVIVTRAGFAIKNVALIKHGGKVTNQFLIQLLKSSIFEKYIRNENVGNTQKFLGLNKIRDYQFLSPSAQEQNLIGEFFSCLDAAIALHQSELTTLKQTKQGFMQKMFPKEGESVPEFRFPGFSGDWEQHKLRDMTNMFNNLRIPVTASDRIKGATPYYGANGVQDFVEGFTHDGEFVLVAEDGANDLINYPVNYVWGKIWVNNHAHVISGKKGLMDNLFLVARIRSMNISSYLVGGGRAKLNGETFKNIPITIPIFEEQERIGNFFKQLDDTIALHQQELEALQQTKKAFLQKMFV